MRRGLRKDCTYSTDTGARAESHRLERDVGRTSPHPLLQHVLLRGVVGRALQVMLQLLQHVLLFSNDDVLTMTRRCLQTTSHRCPTS